jgi:hypothetical protein
MEEIREVYEVSFFDEDTREELTLEPLEDGDGITVTWDERGIIRFEP